MNNSKTLKAILQEKNLNLSQNPRGTDKGDPKPYIESFYESYFKTFRDRDIELLEIGVRHGASLCLWSTYFERAVRIVGIDNTSDITINENSPVNLEWISNPNVQLLLCNAYIRQTANTISGKFDIIIDDGPHMLKSQIKCLSLYYNMLKYEGLFIIEDLLKGYFTCMALLFLTPLDGEARIFDLRKHHLGRDNMLFVVTKRSLKLREAIRRLILILFYICRPTCTAIKMCSARTTRFESSLSNFCLSQLSKANNPFDNRD